MKAEDLKKRYGDEYPAAVVLDGVRMPLQRESRFSRSYHSEERKMGSVVSRFMDGSATMTYAEVQAEWPNWSEDERSDFCQACGWLEEQSDFPEILRFIMQHGGPADWSRIASSVASSLPGDEAFETLLRALHSTDIGHTANLSQAVAITKHRYADVALRRHLGSIWAHPSLWADDKFVNWIAFDATTCIEHLMELGAAPADFEDHVRRLSQHVCSHNRDSCRNYLSRYYSWLK